MELLTVRVMAFFGSKSCVINKIPRINFPGMSKPRPKKPKLGSRHIPPGLNHG